MAKLGDDIGAVWIATNARTGSMWTTNVAREIVRAEGFAPLPETRSVREPETLAYGERHVVEGRPGVAVLKVHRRVPPLPRSIGLITQRDVRDAFMSFMRFMQLSFSEALARYPAAALAHSPERLFEGDRRYLVQYTMIRDHPAEAVHLIAGFMGAERATSRSEDIAAMFTKSAVKRRVDAAEIDLRTRGNPGDAIEDGRLIVLTPTNWRARDKETGFQSGHVSDYHDGDWRWLLSAEQQSGLNALIEAAGHSMV